MWMAGRSTCHAAREKRRASAAPLPELAAARRAKSTGEGRHHRHQPSTAPSHQATPVAQPLQPLLSRRFNTRSNCEAKSVPIFGLIGPEYSLTNSIRYERENPLARSRGRRRKRLCEKNGNILPLLRGGSRFPRGGSRPFGPNRTFPRGLVLPMPCGGEDRVPDHLALQAAPQRPGQVAPPNNIGGALR